MEKGNAEKLKKDELQQRGHTEVLDYLIRDIDSIVSTFGGVRKESLERELVDLIIQNR